MRAVHIRTDTPLPLFTTVPIIHLPTMSSENTPGSRLTRAKTFIKRLPHSRTARRSKVLISRLSPHARIIAILAGLGTAAATTIDHITIWRAERNVEKVSLPQHEEQMRMIDSHRGQAYSGCLVWNQRTTRRSKPFVGLHEKVDFMVDCSLCGMGKMGGLKRVVRGRILDVLDEEEELRGGHARK